MSFKFTMKAWYVIILNYPKFLCKNTTNRSLLSIFVRYFKKFHLNHRYLQLRSHHFVYPFEGYTTPTE